MFKVFVLLYNMRAQMVGINHIKNTYMRHLHHNANEDVWFEANIFGCNPGLGRGHIGWEVGGPQ